MQKGPAHIHARNLRGKRERPGVLFTPPGAGQGAEGARTFICRSKKIIRPGVLFTPPGAGQGAEGARTFICRSKKIILFTPRGRARVQKGPAPLLAGLKKYKNLRSQTEEGIFDPTVDARPALRSFAGTGNTR